MKKKEKKKLSDIALFNRSLNRYKKSVFFLFWAGIINFLAAIIGVIQSKGEFWPSSGYALSFSSQIFINTLLYSYLDPMIAIFIILIISMVLGAFFVLCGIYSQKGYVILFYLCSGFYLLDFIFLFFVYFLIPLSRPIYNWTNFAFTLVMHLVVLFFIGAGYYYYFKVNKMLKKNREVRKHKNLDIDFKEEVEIIAIKKEEDSLKN